MVNIGRILLSFSMMMTYPMECYVSRHCLFSLWNYYNSTLSTSNTATNSNYKQIGSSTSYSSATPSAIFVIQDEEDEMEEIQLTNAIHMNHLKDNLNPEDCKDQQSIQLETSNNPMIRNMISKNAESVSWQNDNGNDNVVSAPVSLLAKYPEPIRYGITLCLWAVVVVIAICFSDVGFVLSLTGKDKDVCLSSC